VSGASRGTDGRSFRESIDSGMNKHVSAIRKAGFGGLFTPTKATRRVRAIAAYRTRPSLTGGCFGPGIFRIFTEFGRKSGASPPRRDNRAAQLPSPEAETGKALVCSFFATRRPEDARHQTGSSRICARRGAHATVEEVLKQAIAASQHWRIIRSGATQHL
jgi:hypothetical protein